MKITYLGTAAAEGFPAVFCNCKFCNEARRLGGKNTRTRSQSIINDDLLIDFPQDSYSHFLSNGIEAHKIKLLLFTHAHQDHQYIDDLHLRYSVFAHDMAVESLKIIAGGEAYENLTSEKIFGVSIKKISPYETLTDAGYKITALPARHAPNSGALIYIIEGEKSILYAHDTGFLYEETIDFIRDKGYVFDLVSLDCTNVDIPISDEGSHMGFDNISRVLTRLREMGCTDDKTVCCVNHFSHNGNPIHSHLEERAKTVGCSVSYDGFSVEFGRG
jgi:phosphoribosyl 1,2-cyclic phosphate phosphodiesterase